jgi:TolB-like protein
MNISNLISELKRRNVFKVAVAYGIAGWLIIQISDTVFPRIGLPDWTITFIIALVVIGLPIALIIAWAFELTPEGIQKSKDIVITDSVTNSTGKKLNGLIISVLSLLIVFLLIERFFFATTTSTNVNSQQATSTATISKKSVAVLPFADLSQNKDQEWFSDGLTEEILNSLAQLPELKVTSRTSAFQFKGKDLDISKIADTLGVANVVEGSVRRIGAQLRITAQLIRAEDGFHLWSET